jgi:hypothetical protein
VPRSWFAIWFANQVGNASAYDQNRHAVRQAIAHAKGVVKKHARRSSHCHHHRCRFFALSAIALSVANQRVLAAILTILAAVMYVAPFAAFFIAIMIYGF